MVVKWEEFIDHRQGPYSTKNREGSAYINHGSDKSLVIFREEHGEQHKQIHCTYHKTNHDKDRRLDTLLLDNTHATNIL